MTSFKRIKVLTVSRAVEKILEDDAPTDWCEAFIDINEVESFYKDSVDDKEVTTVRFKSNNCLTINISIGEFVVMLGLSHKRIS